MLLAAHGTWKSGPLLLEDRWALALIDRAEKRGVAVLSVDPLGPDSTGRYSIPHGDSLGLVVHRADSWTQARSFVRSLSSRGLLFQIALEERRKKPRVAFTDRAIPFWAWSTLFEFLYLALLLVSAILLSKMDQVIR